MGILRNLIDKVTKAQYVEEVVKPDIFTCVTQYIKKKGIQNINPNFQQRIIDMFQRRIDNGKCFLSDYEYYIQKMIDGYYEKSSYTIEIVEKDKELRDKMRGYVYIIKFDDNSYYKGLYIWNLRATSFPIETISEKVIADVENELIKQNIEIAKINSQSIFC